MTLKKNYYFLVCERKETGHRLREGCFPGTAVLLTTADVVEVSWRDFWPRTRMVHKLSWLAVETRLKRLFLKSVLFWVISHYSRTRGPPINAVSITIDGLQKRKDISLFRYVNVYVFGAKRWKARVPVRRSTQTKEVYVQTKKYTYNLKALISHVISHSNWPLTMTKYRMRAEQCHCLKGQSQRKLIQLNVLLHQGTTECIFCGQKVSCARVKAQGRPDALRGLGRKLEAIPHSTACHTYTQTTL